MEAADGVYQAFLSYHTKTISDADWSLAHPDLWRVVAGMRHLLEGT